MGDGGAVGSVLGGGVTHGLSTCEGGAVLRGDLKPISEGGLEGSETEPETSSVGGPSPSHSRRRSATVAAAAKSSCRSACRAASATTARQPARSEPPGRSAALAAMASASSMLRHSKTLAVAMSK
eukprot:scaffold290392_cov30-Tisochrysis_lutea.AAC.2